MDELHPPPKISSGGKTLIVLRSYAPCVQIVSSSTGRKIHAMKAALSYTPVKVRGKRGGIAAEKWNTDKRRRAALQKRRDPFVVGVARSKPKARAHQQDVCRPVLEALPPEILQEIFIYSGNVELPPVSKEILFNLSKSQHLRTEMASRLLDPILDTNESIAPELERRAATRLMNCKFFTVEFFVEWIERRAGSSTPRPLSLNAVEWQRAWATLRPSEGLLPPKKLLLPPFTKDKVSFLSILAPGVHNIAELDVAYGEFAYEALVAAAGNSDSELVALLLGMGVKPTTEVVTAAVMDGDCDEDVVRRLLHNTTNRTATEGEVDLLDRTLWNWAEKAKKQGNEKGEWLMRALREAAISEG
jgi:hypothetical protein